MADRAILIDVDGTLVDSTYLHAVAWAGALRTHGIDIPTARSHRLIGMQGSRLLAELIGEERAAPIAEQAEEEHSRRFKGLRDQVFPLTGARRLLEGLRAREVPVVLTSSAQEEEIKHYLGLLGAGHLVAGWTSAGDVEHSKPDPEPVLAALEKSGCRQGLVIGDSPWDVIAAKGAGLPAAAVRTGGFATSELEESGAAIVCEDLDELCDRLDEVVALAGQTALA
ncbi:MAG TPA: HAD family hydrolase [Gaiellales bacterium]|jgi:HAD superfamily hydrolase (TIGR01549 family)